MRSPVSRRSTLCLLLPFLVVTSCCEIEFLAPLPFSLHAAESIELRVQVTASAAARRSFLQLHPFITRHFSAQLQAPVDAATEVQLWHAGEKIFAHSGSFAVKWPHNGAFTLLATANANQSNPSRSSSALSSPRPLILAASLHPLSTSYLNCLPLPACNTTIMFRKDDRVGPSDSFQQMKLVRLLQSLHCSLIHAEMTNMLIPCCRSG
jgi:hypothetical protein